MAEPAQRICSLLPSATEIVCALGLSDRLVGVTHECDFPSAVRQKPKVTSSVIDSEGLSGAEIDQAVRDSLTEEATIYHLDRTMLDHLRPDLILTQELCDVCAVGTDLVKETVATLSSPPKVVSLEPRTVNEVLESILTVGRLTGTQQRGAELVQQLQKKLDRVRQAVRERPVVPVLTLEWVDPVFVGGHWVPEMVRMAGGRDVLGQAGQPSRQSTWREVADSRPEVVIAMPCGFGVERSAEELSRTALPAEWSGLPAVRADRVFVVDGSSYFNRPGPRLIEGVEILARLLHPDVLGVLGDAPEGSCARYAVDTVRN